MRIENRIQAFEWHSLQFSMTSPCHMTYSGRFTTYPNKWSPVSSRSSARQGKFAGQRPTFYQCAMERPLTHISRSRQYSTLNISLTTHFLRNCWTDLAEILHRTEVCLGHCVPVCLAISEIFSVKQWRNLGNQVRGRSRSFKMTPFDRPHSTFYSSATVNIALSCTIFEFFDIE